MDFLKLTNTYFGVHTYLRNLLDAKHSKKMTHRYLRNAACLTATQRKQVIKHYAPYVKIDPLFHSFYFEKTGVFDLNFLPTDVYYTKVDPYFNSSLHARVIDNKCLYEQLFHGIRQPDTVVCRMGGLWYDAHRSRISLSTARDMLSAEPAVFVKKATSSSGGYGVIYLAGQEVNDQFVQTVSAMSGDIIVQRPLRQHPALSTIHESSVNTLRLVSLISESGVKIYSSVLRIGLGGAKVDNASSGGIVCGIDDDGKLKTAAFRTNGEKFLSHPTSGVVFEGYEIPCFEKAKELVFRAHAMLPHFRLVSWDISIDEQGNAVLVEANLSKGELDFHQLTNGPLFGEDTKKILDEVFSESK